VGPGNDSEGRGVTAAQRARQAAARVPLRFRRGAALLPSLFTLGNLFMGFWSIVRSIHGQFAEAAQFIGAAAVFDMLDGRIARLTGTSSEFGAELDSLSDVISFGLAPALLAYSWAFTGLPRPGALAAFLFLMCGTLRLARFNVQRNVVDGRFFVGLPIPAAAWQVAAVVLLFEQPVLDRRLATAVLVGVVLLAFLMVSTFRYHSFKGVDLRSRRSYMSLLGVGLAFLLVALHPEWVLLTAITAFTLSAPLAYVVGALRRRLGGPPKVEATPAPTGP
jgi:CDP-diacylglycerol--serine O-phosphatidyltransferase